MRRRSLLVTTVESTRPTKAHSAWPGGASLPAAARALLPHADDDGPYYSVIPDVTETVNYAAALEHHEWDTVAYNIPGGADPAYGTTTEVPGYVNTRRLGGAPTDADL